MEQPAAAGMEVLLFTGLVETMGVVKVADRQPGKLRLEVRSPLPMADVKPGDSIAVDGCCLTVTDKQADSFCVDVAEESLRRTTLGRVQPGTRLHLEQAMLGSTRFGGHFVQGHVDGVAELIEKRADGDSLWMTFRVPQSLSRYMVEKGAIAIDGVSLTLTAAKGDTCSVMLIPHTQKVTHLAAKAIGDGANIEVDMLAKHIERLQGSGATSDSAAERPPREISQASSRGTPRLIEGRLIVQPGTRFALVASRFNAFIVDRLLEGALEAIRQHGGTLDDVTIVRVPGAWELPPIVQSLASQKSADAIIALGAVIRGSTPHFEYVSGPMTSGLASIALNTGVPVAFGVLTTETIEQAIERAGTKHGNKGWEAALAAIEMASLRAALAQR